MDRLSHVLKWEAENQPILDAVGKDAKKRKSAYLVRYMRERVKVDKGFLILQRCRARVRSALRSQGAIKHRKTLRLLGCDTGHLKRHLESLWLLGMCWENYGEWHIDHIRPCASFDLLDPAQQRACFHWSNLQPLWAMDNFQKKDKWNAPVPDGALMVIWSTHVG